MKTLQDTYSMILFFFFKGSMARWFVHTKGKSEKLIAKPNSSSPIEWDYKKEGGDELGQNAARSGMIIIFSIVFCTVLIFHSTQEFFCIERKFNEDTKNFIMKYIEKGSALRREGRSHLGENDRAGPQSILLPHGNIYQKKKKICKQIMFYFHQRFNTD